MRRMSFQAFGFLMLLVFALFSMSQADTFVSKNQEALSIEGQLATNDFEHRQKISRLTSSYFALQGESMEEDIATDVYGFKGKSVKRAFVYSMVLPGAGEFYAGSKIRSAVFFGLDVTFWALYFNYRGKGKDKEDEYIAFADRNWNEEDYRTWWAGLDSAKRAEYTETLPDEHNQQYYEMIGKYPHQFGQFWSDFDGQNPKTDSLKRYMDMRHESNQFLDKAKYSAMFSLANHILSAFDAAIMVKKYNKKGERFGQVEFKMRLTERDTEIVPKLFMSMRF